MAHQVWTEVAYEDDVGRLNLEEYANLPELNRLLERFGGSFTCVRRTGESYQIRFHLRLSGVDRNGNRFSVLLIGREFFLHQRNIACIEIFDSAIEHMQQMVLEDERLANPARRNVCKCNII